MRAYPAGYQKVLELFGDDPMAQGKIWYFDPTATGNGSGGTPANAFKTAAHLNKASFARGDNLLFKAGTVTVFTEKVRNKKMLGVVGNPFFVGAYHIEDGEAVEGLGGLARPRIQGLAESKFNPYAGMSNATMMSMIPTPDKNADGSFKEGSLEGLFNWYDSIEYDLMLWVRDLDTRYSGGRHFRFTQSTGGVVCGLLMENCYHEGSMKQAVHLAGVYDWIIKAPRITLSGVEFNYWNPPSNRQAAIGSKGTQNDPDTPVNGWYDDLVIWQGWSSEAVNSNSGNRAVGIINSFAVDQGLYCYYLDRTADMLAGQCIAIRTDGEKFKDYTDAEHGRGSCAFEVQNESHSTSFDWDGTYNTPEDFAKYRTHDAVVDQAIAIGFARSFGLQSQASTKSGATHEGEPHAGGVYYHGCLSINPIVAHWFVHAGNNNDAYVIDTVNPPRVWGCAHIGSAPFMDRKEPQMSNVFRGNYFDRTPPDELSEEAIIGGLVYPIAEYDDLSVLMDTDDDGWMNEEQVLSFRAKVRELLHPETVMDSPIPTSDVSYPQDYTMSTFEPVDMAGTPWGDKMPIGPYTNSDEPVDPENPGDLEHRVTELEEQVADLTQRVESLESGGI